MDRKEMAERIAHINVELDNLQMQFNRANSNSELEDDDRRVWDAIVKAADFLNYADRFVDKHYFGM